MSSFKESGGVPLEPSKKTPEPASSCIEQREEVSSRTRAPLLEALDAFQAKDSSEERKKFAENYLELMDNYEKVCGTIYDATDAACRRLVAESKIPDFSKCILSPNEREEDELQRDLKRKFCSAMDRLQTSAMPKKHRGNLPKEAVAKFRNWFNSHYNHPYPSDEEKQALSKDTGVGIPQITNWFINYRKRVWKPEVNNEASKAPSTYQN